jgi:hypothetical protein
LFAKLRGRDQHTSVGANGRYRIGYLIALTGASAKKVPQSIHLRRHVRLDCVKGLCKTVAARKPELD